MYNKIIIICDLNGKILKSKSNFINLDKNFFFKKRIFNLINKDYVIGFINQFNKTKSILTNKKFKMSNICIDINNKIVNTDIYVKKFYKNIIFFIISNNDILKKKKDNFLVKFFFITRLKFIVGSFSPFIFTIFWIYYKYSIFSFFLFILLAISLCFLHIAANTFNDYFDWISNRDINNYDYVLLSTGGSRAIDFKLTTPQKMFNISIISMIIVLLIGIYFIFIAGYKIFILGIIAFFSIYFYSAPPIHLASRFGAGEFMHIVCLGPLITYGVCLVLVKNADIMDFFIGVPFGLFITCCLLINEYPDAIADKKSGKNNLAVLLGEKYIGYLFVFLACTGFLIIILFIIMHLISEFYYLILLLTPYLYVTCIEVLNIKKKTTNACIKSLNLYIYFCIIITIITIIIIINN